MIDLMALLTAPGAVPGSPTLPGLALGREDGGFDAVLDQVVSQIAAMLVPVAPTLAGEVAAPTLPTLGFAPSNTPGNPELGDSEVAAVAPNAVEALFAGATVTLSKVMGAAHGAVRGASELPVAADTKTDAPAEPTDPTAALVAAIRVGLGLPTPASVTPAPAADAATTKKALPEHAVAVGRIGQMPTLPEHAQATLPMPTGIARRFAMPTALPTAMQQESSTASMPAAPAFPGLPDLPGLPELPAMTVAPEMTDVVDMATQPTIDAPEMPAVAFAPLAEATVPQLTTMATDVAPSITAPELIDVARSTEAPLVAATVADVVAPAAVAEPINDIAVPDAPPTGVVVDESKPAMEAANADHTPMAVFDDAPPTQEDRLNAIAPPLISSSTDPADNNDTQDTLVAPVDNEAPPQAAAVVNQPVRDARPDRTSRVHEANGLAAPLRAAMRDRASNRRDGSFELTVRLDPPELGAVRVRVFTQGDNVKITLHADSPEARTVLQQRHDDVREVLRHEGFNLDGFDVESHDQRQNGSEQSSRRRSSTPAPVFEEQPEDDGALRL